VLAAAGMVAPLSEANAATSLLTHLTLPAFSSTVYTGCPLPPASTVSSSGLASGQVFYVDPVHGSMSGDGSKARPWHTLAEVVNNGLFANMPSHWDNTLMKMVNRNPNAPIKPGATIYLLSGNHGKVLIQGTYGTTLTGYDNPQFITIAALPGQTPVLTQLAVLGGNKWAFRGLTIQGINTTGKFMTSYNGVYNDYWLVAFTGPHNNIIFDGNHLLSQADTSAWSISDWQQKRASGIEDIQGSCIAITNNTLKNVGFAITSQRSNQVLISGNSIDHFSDDGIDWGNNNTTIQNNTITNSVEDGDAFHRDGMQGSPYDTTKALSNIVISGNTVIRVTDPALKYPGALQGISEFDGIWKSVRVTNNVVITDQPQGIAFFGVSQLTLSSNILLGDSGKVLPCYNLNLTQCQAKSIVYDTSMTPTLNVGASKVNAPSVNVLISGNWVSGLTDDKTNQVVTMTQNKCIATTQGKCVVAMPINGVMTWTATPGTYNGITILPTTPAQFFKVFDPVNMIYDLRPH